MLADLMNPNTQMNKKVKVILVDIEDIKTNNLNAMPLEDVDELAESIYNKGLYSPLEIYEKNGEYILIGGERRYTALMKLYNEGRLDNPEIQCSLRDKPQDEFLELLQMCLSNAQRDSEDARISQTKMLLTALEKATSEEIEMMKKEASKVFNIEKSKIGKREMIASQIGRSPRTIDKYINKIKGKDTKENSAGSQEKAVKEKTQVDEVSEKLQSQMNEICDYLEELLGIPCKYSSKKAEIIMKLNKKSSKSLIEDYNTLAKNLSNKH